jgi:hypothetical protein
MNPGTPIRANISASGCRRRDRLGRQGAAFSIALFGAFVVLRVPWFWRLLLFIPAAGAATSILQSRRTTCVLRARQGTFENEDGSTRPVSEEEARASRAIARGIQRDAALIGAASTGVAVALAFV